MSVCIAVLLRGFGERDFFAKCDCAISCGVWLAAVDLRENSERGSEESSNQSWKASQNAMKTQVMSGKNIAGSTNLKMG
jgi:hypothetical protein